MRLHFARVLIEKQSNLWQVYNIFLKHMPPKLLNNFLEKENIDPDLSKLLFSIARAGKFVAHAIRTGDLGLAGTSNLYGENQLALDVLADMIFTNHLKATELVSVIASEEKDDAEQINKNGKFAVAFDPLDGSSLVTTNLSIGAIFGIFEGNNFIGKKGRDMVASCYLIFGPRTVFVMAIRGKILEFTMNELGEFSITNENMQISPVAKTFSPGNLRASSENEKYAKLVDYWQKKPLTLRYSGGMVPDIHQIFAKGNGIFSYPSFSKHPDGKLRLLFECAPFAFASEQAGGLAKDEKGQNILDLEIKEVHQRTPIFIGSKEEVKKSLEYLNS